MNYQIRLEPSGHTFTCDSDTEILQAGLSAGLFMAYSCRSGVCNTCRGRVTGGQIEWGATHPKYLSEEDKAKGYALLCQARPKSDVTIEVAEIAEGASLRPKFMPVRVLGLERAASDVMLVKIGLPMNEPTLFRAGQYIDLVSKTGVHRSYSVANAPSNDGVRQLELHIRHLPGGLFTDRLFNGIKVGDVMRAEFPLGSFFLRHDEKKSIILLASGTGFAPIESIIRDNIQRGDTRPMTLYWGGRTKPDLYKMALCLDWAREHKHFTFVPVLSEPTPACEWSGRVGFVHKAVMQDHPDLSAHQVYACGAPVVIESARHEYTKECGLCTEDFFADSFLTAKEKSILATA